jgi:hypothetical protein
MDATHASASPWRMRANGMSAAPAKYVSETMPPRTGSSGGHRAFFFDLNVI